MPFSRRQLLVAACALFAAKLARAQNAARPRQIGYLSWAPPDWQKVLTAAFLDGVSEHGYADGKNVAIHYRRGSTQQLAGLAAELVQMNVEVIVTLGTPAAVAAKAATSKIPVVFTLVTDPIASGLITNLAKPGGNVTGLSMLAPSVYAKAYQLLAETVPKLSRVAVLMDPTNAGHTRAMKDVGTAAAALGGEAMSMAVRNGDELDRALAEAVSRKAEALYVFPVRLSAPELQKVVAFAKANRIATLMSSAGRVVAGGLMSYAVDYADQVRRTGGYIHKILNGANPGDLPIEQPTKFDLAVNLKTAKDLGLTIPQSILLRADRVIE